MSSPILGEKKKKKKKIKISSAEIFTQDAK